MTQRTQETSKVKRHSWCRHTAGSRWPADSAGTYWHPLRRGEDSSPQVGYPSPLRPLPFTQRSAFPFTFFPKVCLFSLHLGNDSRLTSCHKAPQQTQVGEFQGIRAERQPILFPKRQNILCPASPTAPLSGGELYDSMIPQEMTDFMCGHVWSELKMKFFKIKSSAMLGSYLGTCSLA